MLSLPFSTTDDEDDGGDDLDGEGDPGQAVRPAVVDVGTLRMTGW